MQIYVQKIIKKNTNQVKFQDNTLWKYILEMI